MWRVAKKLASCVAVAVSVFAVWGVTHAAEYYLSNKPGSGSGTKDDPFGLADLPKPDNKPTRALTVLRPGDTLYFKGGEYALHTGPVKDFYYVGYLRPALSGEPGKPISFCACPGETVVLTAARGGQPIFGNLDRDYVRHEGFVIKGSIGHVGGKGAEIAHCEIIGQYVDTADNHDGIRIEHADRAWIHHNVIHGVQGKSGNSVGIKIYKSQNLVVEDNYIYDNTRGIFDKDSGINNTYRRNFLTKNRLEQFHGNNQGKYMVARIYDNVIDGHVALGYLVDGTEVHDNLIRGDMLAGHWAGELWNTRLWNNIVVSAKDVITAYNESTNPFVNTGDKKHLAYMDYNVYTAPPKYTFGREAFDLERMRSHGFEQHSQVVADAGEIFKDEQSWDLLSKWKTAGRDHDPVGPEDVALVLDLRRYGPAGRDFKLTTIPSNQGIEAVQVGAKTIRVLVPRRFETDFTTVKGFGHTWFDLAHDPQKKRDLAPVLEENGLLWTKMGIGDGKRVGVANPPKEMKLLESGPVRVRVRGAGVMNRRGLGIPQEDLNEVGFEQTFTVYPTGQVYVDYALLTKETVPLHHFLLILKPNGAWGSQGKGEGAGEVRCAGEAGANRPYGKTASSFALEWTNGPTYFQDMLMVMYRGKYNGTYWNEGYLDKDLRCGLDLLGRWKDKILPKGKDHILLMLAFRDDIDGREAAGLYAQDYRTPGKLHVTVGNADTTDAGDYDADGFSEAEGCYVLTADKGVAFTLPAGPAARMFPAFKIKGWIGDAPRSMKAGGRDLKAGSDYNAATARGVLMVQLLSAVKGEIEIVVPAAD
jgi:hypothetical protein